MAATTPQQPKPAPTRGRDWPSVVWRRDTPWIVILLCTLSPLWAAHAGPLSASDTWYHIELVFFAQPHTVHAPLPADALTVFPSSLTAHRLPQYLKPYSRETTPQNAQALQALPPRFFRLRRIEKKLQLADGYRVIGHAAWAQPLSPTTTGRLLPTLLLPFGRAFTSDGMPITHPTVQAAARDADWQWTHTLHVKIQLSHFFTVAIEAQHRNPHTAPPDMVTDFKQTRRMRSQQLNYFDHPQWGVLMTIIPIPNHRPVLTHTPSYAPWQHTHQNRGGER